MHPRAWRIVSRKYVEQAFDGDGARRYGGRWNRKGVAMVYASQSRALALLEMLVHDPLLLGDYVFISVSLPDRRQIQRLSPESLPNDWRRNSALPQLQTIGGEWIARNQAVALWAPSLVLPAEFNLLLNPRHPDFSSLIFGQPEAHQVDERLKQTLMKRFQPPGKP